MLPSLIRANKRIVRNIMNSETRTCQNCHNPFTIEPEDFQFYEKIKVPPPTFCPECRLIRRYAWRNERALYKTHCAHCNQDIFSAYPADSPFPVFCHNCWFSDAWDPLSYGREYDFSRSFFEQVDDLFKNVPRLNLFHLNAINSPYANITRDVKDVYLSYSVVEAEEIFYSKNIDRSRQMFDCFAMEDSEQCMGSMYGEKDYDIAYSFLTGSSLNSMFLFDSQNASDCFLSTNLRSRKYVLRNKQYSKEEYKSERQKIDTGSYATFSRLVEEFKKMPLRYPRKYADILKSVNATGNILANVKNARHIFECYDMEDTAYCGRNFALKDSLDVNNSGLGSELIYEYVSGGKLDRGLKFCVACFGSSRDLEYCGWCKSSSDLLGCFGLQNKKFCILNKEYPEQEYRSLRERIMRQMGEMPYMGKNGTVYRYGEFFPTEMSPFGYNESLSQEQYPLTKAKALAFGYRWRDPDIKNPVIDIRAGDLPDHIKDTNEDILSKTIGCAHQGSCDHLCTVGFRVIQRELEFYKKLNVPLPRLCPNCRYYDRLTLRTPWKLWHRKCHCAGEKSENGVYANTGTHPSHAKGEHCPNEFETSYAPERPEIVYCESCYNSEVA